MRPHASYGSTTSFGTILTTFWDSDVGAALQRAGWQPLILYLYLKSNRHANAWGVYELPLDEVLLELPILETKEAVLAAFDLLEELGLAAYDEASQHTWVIPLMGERMNIKEPDKRVKTGDKRWLGLMRMYVALPDNVPFLAPSFDANKSQCNLPSIMRREGLLPWQRRRAHGDRPFTPRRSVASGSRRPARVDYATIADTFWDGEIGRALQCAGWESLVLYLHLESSRQSNMVGLYRLLLPQVLRELPIMTEEAVVAAFDVLAELGLAFYDDAGRFPTRMVWVVDMVVRRVNRGSSERPLTRGDNQWLGVMRTYARLPANPFSGAWFDRHKEAFNLLSADRKPGTPWQGRRAHGDQPRPTESPLASPLASPFPSPFPSPFGATVEQTTGEQQTDKQENRAVETVEAADVPPIVEADRATMRAGASAASTSSHRPHLDDPPTRSPVQPELGPRLVSRAPPPTVSEDEQTILTIATAVRNLLILLRRWASYEELLEAAVEYFANEPRRSIIERGVSHAVTEERRVSGDERIRTLWRESTEHLVTGEGS